MSGAFLLHIFKFNIVVEGSVEGWFVIVYKHFSRNRLMCHLVQPHTILALYGGAAAMPAPSLPGKHIDNKNNYLNFYYIFNYQRNEDPNLKSAEVLLATTQKDTTGCDIQVSPSFKVVDREVINGNRT